jgi:hypothetical protein
VNGPAREDPGVNGIQNQAWHEVSIEKGKVKVSMPGAPVFSKQTVRGASGPIVSLIHKVQMGSMAFNFSFVTYKDAAIKTQGGESPFLENLATTMMIQRPGSQQDSLDSLEGVGCPAVEQKYHFPAGPSSSGGMYGAGYGRQRLYLRGNQLCWLLVEVPGSSEDDREKEETDIRRFFDSLTISGLTEVHGTP